MLVRVVLLALMMSMTGTTQAMGRLFTTNADRQALDNNRLGRTQHVDEQVQVQRQSLQLNGVVRVNQMTPNIWLNGSPSDLKEDPGLKLGTKSSSRRIELELPRRNLKVNLKPGQTLDLLTGQQKEAFSDVQPKNSAYDNTEAEQGRENTAVQNALDTPDDAETQ